MDQEEFDMMPEQAQDEEELDPNNPDHAFAILEKNYNKIVSEMEEDPTQATYLEEFVKLFDYLSDMREKSLFLTEENQRIEEELAIISEQQNDCNIKIAKDSETITKLERDVEDAHQLIDNAHSREQTSIEIIDVLRKQIAALNVELELRNKMMDGNIVEIPVASQKFNSAESEKERLKLKVNKLNTHLKHAMEYQETLESNTEEKNIKLKSLLEELEIYEADIEKHKQIKVKLESEVENQKLLVEGKQTHCANLEEVAKNSEILLQSLNMKLKEKTEVVVQSYKQVEIWNQRYAKLGDKYNELSLKHKQLVIECEQAKKAICGKMDEINKLQLEISQLKTQALRSTEKIAKVEKEKSDITSEKDLYLKEIAALKNKVDAAKKNADLMNIELEKCRRTKEMLNQEIQKLDATNQENTNKIKLQNLREKNLLDTINTQANNLNQKKKENHSVTTRRDRLLKEVLTKEKQFEELENANYVKSSVIKEAQIKLVEQGKEFKKQQSQLTTLKKEKHILKKELNSVNVEYTKLHNAWQDQAKIQEYMKAEYTALEINIRKRKIASKKLCDEKEQLKIDLSKARSERNVISKALDEIKDDNKVFSQQEVEYKKLMQNLNTTIANLDNERNILNYQVHMRNDEVSLLHEKVKLLEVILHSGETQYGQRLEDIKLLKLEIKRLRQEKQFFIASIKDMSDIKQEIFHLERDLTKERIKNKALEEEFQNPMNLHRWRFLEGSNPDVNELIKKAQLLHKQGIKRGNQLIDTQRQLKETQALYKRLKQMVSKHPEPGSHEHLFKMKQELADGAATMKTLQSELQMLEIENKEKALQLSKTNVDLTETRKLLLIERKKRAKELETLKALQIQVTPPSLTSRNVVKYTGGGYRLALPATSAIPQKIGFQ